MVALNLYFAQGTPDIFKTAVTNAAQTYGTHLMDDAELNLFFTTTDQLGTNVAAAAFPSTLGGVDYDYWNQWDEEYEQGLRDRNYYSSSNFKSEIRIPFQEYFEALSTDAISSRDLQSIANLERELVYSDASSVVGATINYRNNFNRKHWIRGMELTTANSKAVGLNRETGSVDGIIAFNSLDRYGADLEGRPAISEYRLLEDKSETEFTGNVGFINVSEVNRTGKKYLGRFDLQNARILDRDGDGNLDVTGDLSIYKSQEFGDRVSYWFKSDDDAFFVGEKNQITFDAEKLDPTKAIFGVTKTILFNYEEVGQAIVQTPYSESNPYQQTQKSLEELALHEIGHILGIVSVTDKIPQEYGDRLLDGNDVQLSESEEIYSFQQSHDITPFDLYRHRELDNGTVERALNPNVNNSGSFFTHDEGETRVKLSEGSHVSVEYLQQIYAADGGQELNPYLDYIIDMGTHQGSHFRNKGAFSAVHDRDDHEHGLTSQDLSALDLIGWDVRRDGTYLNSTVTVNQEIDETVLPDLEYALFRRRTASGSSRTDTRYGAENGTESEDVIGLESANLQQSILDSFL